MRTPDATWLRGPLCALLASLSLMGCASFRGQPEGLETKADVLAPLQGDYKRTTVLRDFAAKKPGEQAGYRNQVAYVWIAASNARYADFKASLSREMKGSSFGANLAVLIMNGAAAVSGAEAARGLAVASATVVGGSAVLNKDVFQERTITAVITTMDAARTRKLTDLRRHLLQDSAADFPLGDALSAVDQLNDAASLYAAADALTASASASKVAAEKEADKLAAISVAVLPPELHAVRVAFGKYVKGLDDKAQLEKLRTLLGAETSEDLDDLKQNIVEQYVAKATTKESINALTDPLKAITGQEFKA